MTLGKHFSLPRSENKISSFNQKVHYLIYFFLLETCKKHAQKVLSKFMILDLLCQFWRSRWVKIIKIIEDVPLILDLTNHLAKYGADRRTLIFYLCDKKLEVENCGKSAQNRSKMFFEHNAGLPSLKTYFRSHPPYP